LGEPLPERCLITAFFRMLLSNAATLDNGFTLVAPISTRDMKGVRLLLEVGAAAVSHLPL
jgi:hypothetical protein